jgi:hypothetical protein
MPADKRRTEFEKKFGGYRKILGDEMFVFHDPGTKKSAAPEKIITLSRSDIVVNPFSSGDYIFMSLETSANRQIFEKQGNKKVINTMIWKPQSNHSNDMKDVHVTVVNVDPSKVTLKKA